MFKKIFSVLLCIIFVLCTVYTFTVSAVSDSTTAIPTAESVNSSDVSFTVNARSNIAKTVSKTYSENVNQLTVTYYLKSDKLISDTEFNIFYDPEVLAVNKAQHTKKDGFGTVKEVNFTPVFDKIGNTSSNLMKTSGSGLFIASSALDPYDFSSENLTDNVFLTITFDVVGNYDKDVDIMLNVYVLTAVEMLEEDRYEFTEYIYQNEIKNAFEENCEGLTALSEGVFVPTEPPTKEPATTEPTTAEPVTTEPTTAEPVTTEPTTAEPTTTEPTTAEPATTEPTTAEPVTTEPTTAEPVTTEPTTAEPATTEPTTAEPTTTEPTTAELATTEPTTTEPATTELTTTEPTTTEPVTTKPPVTDPTDPPKPLGDANGDGKVNVKDVTYIQLYFVKLLDENRIDLSVCDVNGDGHINIKDATYIQLRLANLL